MLEGKQAHCMLYSFHLWSISESNVAQSYWNGDQHCTTSYGTVYLEKFLFALLWAIIFRTSGVKT